MKIDLPDWHINYPAYGVLRERKVFLLLPTMAHDKDWNRQLRWLEWAWVIEMYVNTTRESWKWTGPGRWKIIGWNDGHERERNPRNFLAPHLQHLYDDGYLDMETVIKRLYNNDNETT